MPENPHSVYERFMSQATMAFNQSDHETARTAAAIAQAAATMAGTYNLQGIQQNLH